MDLWELFAFLLSAQHREQRDFNILVLSRQHLVIFMVAMLEKRVV